MAITLHILGRDLDLPCDASQEQRIGDLAAALDARMRRQGDGDDMGRLVLTALALLDETQATGAALTRARLEIERLTDMLVEARLQAEPPVRLERSRVQGNA